MTADAGSDPSLPVTAEQWRAYLTEYSDWYLRVTGLTIEDVDDTVPMLSPITTRQISARWLGHEPATGQMIAETEERLGVKLPPSLRGFLLVSNGWGPVSEWTDALSPCDDIDWFRNTHPAFFPSGDGQVTDNEEDTIVFFGRCLSIARGEDAFLLDTGEVSADGEYDAYLLAVKYGDAEGPCKSFSELIALGRAEIESLSDVGDQ